MPAASKPFFWWGSATSAYQVEGGNIWSDWHDWEKKQGLEPCGQAVRHYQYFAQDFSQAKSLGQNSQRLSFEWGRLEPSLGEISQEAIAHYRKVLQTLQALDLKVCLTLNHFTLPTWLARAGGWENEQAVEFFKNYVGLIVNEFGQWVDLWLTINEPQILATEAYWYGHWPPQVRFKSRFVKVMHNLAQAHIEAYKLIHLRLPQAQVGLAHNFFSWQPLNSWSPLDKLAQAKADRFWNQWLMDLTAGYHDFLGVNYYFHQRVFFSLNWRRGFVSFADPKLLNLEVSALGWEINPAGLSQVLLKLWQRYQLPLYVTENGLATNNEEQRINFIKRSIAAVALAMAAGAQVKGYFYWSLLDNYEWDKGFGPKFGLIAVERKTFMRKPRPAAEVYAAYCRPGSPHEALS